MRGGHYLVGVAVRRAVVADAAVPVPGVGGGDRGGCLAAEEKAGTRDEGAVQKVAPRDRLVHAEAIVLSVGRGGIARSVHQRRTWTCLAVAIGSGRRLGGRSETSRDL